MSTSATTHDEKLKQHIAKVVAGAPKLSDAQRDRIASILRGGSS
jgi:hypothetical protein